MLVTLLKPPKSVLMVMVNALVIKETLRTMSRLNIFIFTSVRGFDFSGDSAHAGAANHS